MVPSFVLLVVWKFTGDWDPGQVTLLALAFVVLLFTFAWPFLRAPLHLIEDADQQVNALRATRDGQAEQIARLVRMEQARSQLQQLSTDQAELEQLEEWQGREQTRDMVTIERVRDSIRTWSAPIEQVFTDTEMDQDAAVQQFRNGLRNVLEVETDPSRALNWWKLENKRVHGHAGTFGLLSRWP